MRNLLLIIVLVLCMSAVTLYAAGRDVEHGAKGKANAELRKTIAELYKVKKAASEKVNIDPETFKQIKEFALQDKKVLSQDDKLLWDAFIAANIVTTQIKKKYKWREKVSKEDQLTLQMLVNLRGSFRGKGELLCFENDKIMTRDFNVSSDIKIRKSGAKSRSNSRYRHSDEYIKLFESLNLECPYGGMHSVLLPAYAMRGREEERFRHKYNKLMLNVIRQDQEVFDFNPVQYDALDRFLAVYFSDFLAHVNTHRKKLILSKKQIEEVAEIMLTKYKDGLKELDTSLEYGRAQNVMFLNTARMLCHYKSDELAKGIFDEFIPDDSLFKGYMREYPEYRVLMDCRERVNP